MVPVGHSDSLFTGCRCGRPSRKPVCDQHAQRDSRERRTAHALAFERELARAGVEIFYALTAGDQTSPEGRLIRHMFRGAEFLAPPEKRKTEYRCYMRDPDGHLIEVGQSF